MIFLSYETIQCTRMHENALALTASVQSWNLWEALSQACRGSLDDNG